MSTANARSVLKRARLAREQQRKEGSSRDDGDHDTTEPIQESRRIQSPLARYDTQGRLSCTICKVVIKSSVDWPAHLTSNSHQATIEQLRKLKRSSTEKNTFNQEEETSEPKKLKTSKDTFTAPRPISKRKITSSSSTVDHSTSISSVSIESIKTEDTSTVKRKRIHKSNTDEMESDTIYMELNEHDQTTTNVDELDSKHQLPANFFDTTPVNDESVNVNTTNNTQHLPKGFFDNASQEDKVRRELGIDATSTATPLSQDTMDLEWKRFQQALGDTTTTTTTQSITQAMAPSIEPSIKTEPQEKEEQEQEEQNNNDLNPLALLQRRWEDEEEQMQDWRDRLDVLQLRAAETRSRLVTTTTITSSTLQQNTDMNEDEDDSEDEDIDLDNLLLDWRTQQLK